MAHALLRFDLANPDDEREHRYALAGRDALIALERLEQHCRGRIKYGQLSENEVHEIEVVRAMIPTELVGLLT